MLCGSHSLQIESEVGQCRPLATIYSSAYGVVCNEAVDGLVSPLSTSALHYNNSGLSNIHLYVLYGPTIEIVPNQQKDCLLTIIIAEMPAHIITA